MTQQGGSVESNVSPASIPQTCTAESDILSSSPIHQAEPASSVNTEKRGRGRPKGSKNKPKVTSSGIGAQDIQSEEPKPKRKRGRPQGSKNKPKVTVGYWSSGYSV